MESEPNGEKQLDNPVWHALQGPHQQFAVCNRPFARYQHGVLSFVACAEPGIADTTGLASMAMANETVFAFGDGYHWNHVFAKPQLLDCFQMIYRGPAPEMAGSPPFDKLGPIGYPELVALVNLVQPGYFSARTADLGRYFGLRQNGELVAVAGERLCLNGYTEISAICTHPDHTGKGYARQLTELLMALNINEGKQPFLHVLKSNTRAVALYQRLGFEIRRDMPIWKIIPGND